MLSKEKVSIGQPSNYASFDFMWHIVTIYYVVTGYKGLIAQSWPCRHSGIKG